MHRKCLIILLDNIYPKHLKGCEQSYNFDFRISFDRFVPNIDLQGNIVGNDFVLPLTFENAHISLNGSSTIMLFINNKY